MTKKQLTLVGKIWAGSQLVEVDGGFTNEQAGLSEKDDASHIITEANRLGAKILGNHPSFANIQEIIKYVKSL